MLMGTLGRGWRCSRWRPRSRRYFAASADFPSAAVASGWWPRHQLDRSIRTPRSIMGIGGSLILGLLATGCGAGIVAVAQTVLPEVVVRASKKAPKPVPHTAHMPARETPAAAAAREFAAKTEAFNQARDRTILPKIGISTYELSHEAIEALPQGDNQSIGKVLLQAPGVHQDSAGSLEGPFHVRNEHDFVQYRISRP
jgi:hypothetical protein